MNLQHKEQIIEVDFRIIEKEESNELLRLQEKFINSFAENKNTMEVDEWLLYELKNNLPEWNDDKLEDITNEIIETIKLNEKNKEELNQANLNGKSKESWFASKIKEYTSNMGMGDTAKYLNNLDCAIRDVNELMYKTITTKSGEINKNFNLDGFIAEQHHANSFNLKSKIKGKDLMAEVLIPKDGQTYAKNSVDIVIKDKSGKIIERYQAKYGKTANDTIKMINNGNYNNQRLLVPAEQVQEVQKAFPNKTVSAVIGSGEVKSKPLTKIEAKKIQKEAQDGKWNDSNWNEYKTKDLAMGIGRQAGYAAIQGAAIGAGMEIASKLYRKEEIDSKYVVEEAMKSGADFGVKAAIAGALKVGVEKGVVKAIPKGTPAGVIANIAYIGVENAKVLWKVANGEITLREGLEMMEKTSVEILAGIALGAKGTELGAIIGLVFGPPGAIVGGFIGGILGYMAGSKVGEIVVKGSQRVRKAAREIVKSTGTYISRKVKNAYSSAKVGLSNVLSL